MACCFGCRFLPDARAPRRSQLEGVSQAALRIKSSIGIGSYRLENASLDDLAYQIALAKRSRLDPPDLQAVAYYERASHTARLTTYLRRSSDGAGCGGAGGDLSSGEAATRIDPMVALRYE